MSRAPQGARGLKFLGKTREAQRFCRAPQGARGLKSPSSPFGLWCTSSRPARGAWVEIASCASSAGDLTRRAPQGARGLKYGDALLNALCISGRAPQGARGLKYMHQDESYYLQ